MIGMGDDVEFIVLHRPHHCAAQPHRLHHLARDGRFDLVWQIVHLGFGHAAAGEPGEIAVRNPFDLKPALLLMLLTMALTVAARWVLQRYGDAGLAVVLAIAGTADVDSAVITMGNLPPGTLAPRTAALVLAAPVALNTLFKTAILLALAGRKGAGAAAAMLASLAAMALAALFI